MNINNVIKSYLPLIITFFGALSLFLSSIIVKVTTTQDIFLSFSQVVIVASVAFTWSPLGFDNYFLRNCRLDSNNLLAKKYEYYIFFSLPILGSILLSIFLIHFIFNGQGNVVEYSLISFTVGVSFILFTLFKALGENFLCQVFSALWKYTLFIIASVLYFYEVSVQSLFSFIMFILIIGSYPYIKNDILERFKVDESNRGINYRIWLAAFFTITIVTLLSQLDRFIISRYLEPQLFTQYFFWSAIYFSPMTIFASFYGAKQFSHYKKGSVDSLYLKKDIVKIILFSITSIIISSIIGYILVDFFNDKITWPKSSVIIGIIIIGLIRSIYILLSNLVQIYIEPKWAFKTGSFLFFMIMLAGVYFELTGGSDEAIISFLVIAWLVRTTQYYRFIINNIDHTDTKLQSM